MYRSLYKMTLGSLLVLTSCQELYVSKDRSAPSIPDTVNTTQVESSPELSIVYPQNSEENSSFIQVAENSASVLRVSAKEAPESKLIYRLQDGADMDKFVLDENTGMLSFKEAPDWEQPQDADKNNNYMVLWQVLSSTGQARSQFLVIQVTDLPD